MLITTYEISYCIRYSWNIWDMKAVLHALSSLGFINKLVVAGDVVTASSGSNDLLQLLFDCLKIQNQLEL